MLEEKIIRAARNNAEWCDAVCRAHGNPGEFHEGMWLNRHQVPRFYPNAGTLGAPSQQQLDLIDELLAARIPGGWAVKDSFSHSTSCREDSRCCSPQNGSTCRFRE